MLPRTAKCSSYEYTVRLADHQTAGLMEQPAYRAALEFGPELIRTLHERYISRVLVVGLADDSRQPMRRSQRMRRRESIEPDDAHTALRQVIERGAAHRSKSDDDDIGGVRHGANDLLR